MSRLEGEGRTKRKEHFGTKNVRKKNWVKLTCGAMAGR
jgi:hypothetical protein